MHKLCILFTLVLLTFSCNNESLQIQTQFPFVVTSESIPSVTSKRKPIVFGLSIVPQRQTVLSTYSLKWTDNSNTGGTLIADKKVIGTQVYTEVSSLSPQMQFYPDSVSTCSFTITVKDENGVTQQLPYSISVSK